MPPIRIPEVPGLSPTPINMPGTDPRAAAAPARALGEVAQAIGSVGRAFAEHGDRIQAAENQRAISSTRSQLDEMRSQLFIDLQKETDPAQHIRKTDAFLQQAKNLVDDPTHAPAVRDRLLPYFDGWATDTRTTAAEGAARLSTKRATMAAQNELDLAVRHNDRTRADTVLDEMAASGLALPEEVEQIRGQLGRQMTFRNVSRQIEEDPLGAAEQLDDPDFLNRFPELAAEDVDRLRSHADQARNRAAGDLWNDTLNAAMDGTVLAPEDLADLADQGLITASQRASYLRTYHSGEPPKADPALYAQIHSAVSRYNPAADPTGIALANLRAELATVPLPKEHLAELRDRLDAQASATTRTGKHRLSSDFAEIIDERFDAGEFGKWFTITKGPQGGEHRTISREDFEEAVVTKRRFLDVWDSFLAAAPPDLDPQEARQAFDAIFESTVTATDSLDLLDLAPAADFGPMVDEALGIMDPDGGVLPPKEPTASSFGGVPIQRMGYFYRDAKPSVFGGTADPIDNGRSAFGGTTGPGGREGVAIPAAILEATFPEKGKAWWSENVRVVVRTPAGQTAVFPVADLGTAEEVWTKHRRPVLDLTPGALRQLGGRVITDAAGQQKGVAGLESLSFALTTVDAGLPLQGSTWEDVWSRWFDTVRPRSGGEVDVAFKALLAAYHEANAPQD